jgi:hypothetical protein
VPNFAALRLGVKARSCDSCSSRLILPIPRLKWGKMRVFRVSSVSAVIFQMSFAATEASNAPSYISFVASCISNAPFEISFVATDISNASPDISFVTTYMSDASSYMSFVPSDISNAVSETSFMASKLGLSRLKLHLRRPGNFISRRTEDLIFSEIYPAVALRHVRLRHVRVAEVILMTGIISRLRSKFHQGCGTVR